MLFTSKKWFYGVCKRSQPLCHPESSEFLGLCFPVCCTGFYFCGTENEEDQLKRILYLNVFIKVSKDLPIQDMGCPSERETRQSCSSLALPHKPTRPDSPDPIWRAGSWFSLLEVIVITVRRGTGYITARRCSYYTIIFTVQLHTVHTMHTPQYTFVFDWGWFEVISTGNGPRALFLGQSFCQGADNE